MLRPHLESNLELNLMVLGADILKLLSKKNQQYTLVESIMQDFLKEDSKRTPDTFLNTLSFLYMVRIIKFNGYKICINNEANQ